MSTHEVTFTHRTVGWPTFCSPSPRPSIAVELSSVRARRSAGFSPPPAVSPGRQGSGLKSALLDSMAGPRPSPLGSLDFGWTAEFAHPRVILELEVEGVSVLATEKVAHGVSRGLGGSGGTSPGGATENSRSPAARVLSPLRAFYR